MRATRSSKSRFPYQRRKPDLEPEEIAMASQAEMEREKAPIALNSAVTALGPITNAKIQTGGVGGGKEDPGWDLYDPPTRNPRSYTKHVDFALGAAGYTQPPAV